MCIAIDFCYRTPFATWRKLLQESEAMANTRMEISQKLQDSVADSIKTLKTERVTTLKKVCIDVFTSDLTVRGFEIY